MSKKHYVSVLALSVALAAGPSIPQGGRDEAVDYKAPPPPPSLNFYGLPGVIDMPNAFVMPDGQVAVTVANFAGTTRTTLSVQFLPRVTASFRYVGLRNFNDFGFDTFRDRSFDLRYQILREGRILPAVTIGLQDLAGTGIYAGEYIVATKTLEQPLRLPGRFNVTAGLGWGRLGSAGAIGAPLGENRPVFTRGDLGGEPSTDQWFRGDVAPFGGIEWQVNDKIGLKVEYSSDAYQPETSRGIFSRDSRLNFGAEYQYSERVRFGAYYLYGSEIGVTAQIQMNPRQGPTPLTIPGPRAVIERPDRATNPELWSTGWATSKTAQITIRDALAQDLRADGLRLEELAVTATEAEVRYENARHTTAAVGIGRTARAMARHLPASVEVFRITPMDDGLALSTVTLQRSDLERLEFAPDSATQLLAAAQFDEATPQLEGSVRAEDRYPRFSWSVGPYVSPSYFDPDQPVRADVGAALRLAYRPAPGWIVAGALRGRVLGNIEDGRESNSVLPRVRTNGVLYAKEGDTSLNRLYAQRQMKIGRNMYGRVSAGYFETMFGGVSGEVLWKPQDSRLALGIEANYARQRDFDQGLGFQDYDVLTGHASAYYEFNGGYLAQVDVGRYLAGDHGATFSLSREFQNGWKVGGFFTLTDVSAEEFGEGSFDKGVMLTIPLNWFVGKPTKQKLSTTIRPVVRDGGARMSVPDRLYEQVRDGHKNDLAGSWGQVWR